MRIDNNDLHRMLPHRRYTNSIRHVIVSEITIVIKCILYTVSEGKNVIKPYLYFMYSGLGGIWTHDHRLRRTVPYPY